LWRQAADRFDYGCFPQLQRTQIFFHYLFLAQLYKVFTACLMHCSYTAIANSLLMMTHLLVWCSSQGKLSKLEKLIQRKE
jgi:hypothetical protein